MSQSPQTLPHAEPPLIAWERRFLADLKEQAARHAQEYRLLDQNWTESAAQAEQKLRQTLEEIEADYAAGCAAAAREWEQTSSSLEREFHTASQTTEAQYQETLRAIAERFQSAKTQIEEQFEREKWSLNTEHEVHLSEIENRYQELERFLHGAVQRVASLQQQAEVLLKRWRQAAAGDSLGPIRRPLPPENRVRQHVDDLVHRAEELWQQLHGLFLPRFFQGANLLWLVLVSAVLMAMPAWLLAGEDPLLAVGVAAIGTVVLATGAAAVVYLVSRGQVQDLYQELRLILKEVEQCRDRCLEPAQSRYQAQLLSLNHKRRTDLKQAADRAREAREQIIRQRIEETTAAERRFLPLLAQIKSQYQQQMAQARQGYTERLAELERQRRQRRQAAERDYQTQTEQARQACALRRSQLDLSWQQQVQTARAMLQRIEEAFQQLYPDWSSPSWDSWEPPVQPPEVLPLGQVQVDLSPILTQVPAEEPVRSLLPSRCTLPVLVPFPRQASILWQTAPEGRTEAVQAIQSLMLRLLTAVPPGKLRFLLFDPVGLGQTFASFMHLADYDEQLLTSRVWTEPQHIEQRLADITAHMETVIQKYLRNQYRDISEYNAQAGEVAEPFRFVVVADFPANFTVEAARRLASIASSGARCGVHTLVLVDSRQPMPQGFDLAVLERSCVCLRWQDGRFRCCDADLGSFPLQSELPPPAPLTNRLLQRIGEAAQRAKRVEVPFAFIAPAAEHYWTADSTFGLSVPLGRAGATKRQCLELGRGTAQHVLVAGKTGSGKSTLMHALITNLALRYSPEEVELYLVDFKKGVEFKTYATHELPHARVIAIESEREFGLSVLQRLDFELKRRADRFRELGAQDLAACRKADPSKPMPRVLLLVDEFQEFFVEDDRIAQEAALLLDRLVRQGRAFGIHVLLGSQTLGGAYTLARSTIDQMAVRIALQCSEVDAHLILSEDNHAARLLSRPGEAIYNDANGLVEGNQPFQVVWLPDEQREEFLKQVQELDRRRHPQRFRDQIVFEGNAPAQAAGNGILNTLLAAPNWPKGSRAFQAWLGDAIAIKDPTAAVFRSQGGSNLLIVGQNEEAALGMMVTALVSLAAQHPPSRLAMPGQTARERTPAASFYVLDGTPADSPHVGLFSRLAALLPHSIQTATWRQAAPVVAELASEVQRRLAEPDQETDVLYLFLYGLHRFRLFRRDEDEYSFGSGDKDKPPGQLAMILREGPAVGVHALVWCDTPNTLNRSLERQSLRDFDMRVLFQMGPGDSSALIDSPLACKLGLHRALYYSEELGRPEKLRPYAVPSESWLRWACGRLQERAVSLWQRHPG